MSKPFFSIIIPSLNEEKYLPRLLEDLSVQTFQDFEVIVVDGQSNDQTVAKAKLFKNRLPLLNILTSPKRHVCTQRNLGAKSAKANILIFCDADNRLPHYFLQGIKYRWESEKADILSPLIQPDDKSSQIKTVATTLNVFMELQMTVKPRFLLESCLIISKICFQNVGGFNNAIDYSEGTVFLETALKLGYRVKIIKDPAYIFSFRRQKTYGTFRVVSDAIKIQLIDLFGLDPDKRKLNHLYPMLGGGVYSNKLKIKKNKVSKFLKNIAKILKDF